MFTLIAPNIIREQLINIDVLKNASERTIMGQYTKNLKLKN